MNLDKGRQCITGIFTFGFYILEAREEYFMPMLTRGGNFKWEHVVWSTTSLEEELNTAENIYFALSQNLKLYFHYLVKLGRLSTFPQNGIL